MQSTLLLNIIIRKSTSILELFPSKNQTLLIRWNPLLILNLTLNIVNRIGRLDFQGDCLSRQRLDENLHATTESEDQVQGRFLLNVIIGEGTSVFKLLAGENETLLVWGDALLVLDLGFHVVDRVGAFNFEGDGFTGQGLDKDLHPATETKDKVKRRFLLNVVIRKGTPVFKLLAGENESLLIGRDPFLVLDFRFDVVDRVRGFDFEGNGFASERLDEDLHASSESEDEVQSRLLLDIVIGEGTAVFKLLAGKDKTLLVGRNALLVLDLRFDVVDRV